MFVITNEDFFKLSLKTKQRHQEQEKLSKIKLVNKTTYTFVVTEDEKIICQSEFSLKSLPCSKKM